MIKKQTYLIWGALLYTLSAYATSDDPACPTTRAPCGVEEVISCAREHYNSISPTPLANNKDFYNSQLFNLANQDGFCKEKTLSPTHSYPPGVVAGTLTQTYYDQFCTYQTGTFFSYENFITAVNATNQVTQAPAFAGSGGFACSTAGSSITENTRLSTQELANYFASEAQETTSAMMGYTTDGHYYRYENSALVVYPGTDPATICPNINCHTAYYPPTTPQEGNYVGVSGSVQTDPALTTTYTPYLWYLLDPETSTYYPQYQLAYSPMTMAYGFPAIPLLATPPAIPSAVNSQLFKVSETPGPALIDAANIANPGILYPGMYVGMGSLQLTGSSMYFYYGWYENNLVPNAPVLLSNFDQFVGDPNGIINDPTFTGFLRDGVQAYEGAQWYWNFRSIGINTSTFPGLMLPTLHQLAMDTARPACHCVGAVTLMINGGCNDFNKRAQYATYFAGEEALNLVATQTQCNQTVTLPGGTSPVDINGANCTLICPVGYTLENYKCVKTGATPTVPTLDTATQNLLTYCQTPISGAYP